jgi:hypothetical protein
MLRDTPADDAPRKDVNNECAIREEFLERPVGVEREVETAFPL